MINRRKAITQVLALLTVENGVMLAAVALTDLRDAAGWSNWASSFDVLVAVMILGILVYRIPKPSLDGPSKLRAVERVANPKSDDPDAILISARRRGPGVVSGCGRGA